MKVVVMRKPTVFLQFCRGACPVLNGIGSMRCTELTAAVTNYVDQTQSIHTVILAANWPLYFYGYEWPDKNQITAEQFESVFKQTISYYQSKGKHVIFFLAPPTGANPRACVVRPMRLTSENNCKLNLQEAMNNARSYRRAFVALLDQLKVDFFDPFKYMCDKATCQVIDGTRIYYLDHEHFSVFGGQFLANAAKDDLRVLLNATKK